MTFNDQHKTKLKSGFWHGVLTMLVLFNIAATLILFVALVANYDNNTKQDEKISTIETQAASSSYLLAHQMLVDVTNQYNLTRNSTCKDITSRLGSVVQVLREANTWLSEQEQEDLFKEVIDGLIDANKDNSYLVTDWEHIEDCLLNE